MEPSKSDTSMMSQISPEMMAMIRKVHMDALVTDLLSVQPMNGDALQKIFESGSDENDLIAAGYEPVCPHTRLMWIKRPPKIEQDLQDGTQEAKATEGKSS
jgi:hypothetical protein